ncbi:MAG: hypothetical protein BA864_04950 [Desulfuromonadales bacterium C00003093]|nr:MAG: hypothetical protein BA864_04950 [Desulfuromonadales bacterium C00003093]
MICKDIMHTDYIFVIGDDGQLLSHSFEQGFPSELLNANLLPKDNMITSKLLLTNKGKIRDFALRTAKHMPGEIHVGMNEEIFFKNMRDTLKTAALIMIACLALGFLLIYFISLSLSKPLENLALGMERIGKGDLDFRLEEKGGWEILNLVRGYNRMTKTIQEQTTRLRASEERYRSLVETITDFVFIIATNGKFIFLNPEFENITGYPAKDFIGRPFTEIFAPEFIESTVDRFKRGLSGEKVPIYEVELKHKDGKTVPVELKVTSLFDDHGQAIGRIGVARDIRDRKQAEEALRVNENRLEALLELNQMTEASLHEITDFALESGVKLTNSRIGYLAFMNEDETVLTMHSWSKEAMAQCKTIDKPISYPVETTGLWGEAVRQRKPIITNDYSTPNPFYKGYPEGHVKINRHMNLPVFDGKRIVAVAGVGNKSEEYDEADVRQLTLLMQGMWRLIQRKRTEEEKEKLQSQLQQAQKMEAIGTLAGGIAHDFNNVLYAIIGYTELSMDAVPEGSKARGNLQEVLKAADRAKNMVQQILTFSRKTEKEKKPISVQSVLKETVNLIRTSLPSTIEIRQDIDADCGPVMADPTQIHEIIMNLGTNAYHAMREKGGILWITLRQEEIGSDDLKYDLDLHSGSYLKLIVEDTGHGIDSNIMEKIFDPYFTTKGVGEGTGMGLSVVHGIVREHGGDIRVYSEPGKGAAFHVYLPLIESGTVEREIISAEPVPTGTERILFVDDEEQIVQMAQQILESLGYHVTPRTSSVEALEAFRAKPYEFDLVITDMTMPNMTGAELAHKLLEIRPDIPILLCTGFSELIDENKAKAIGIREYVMKPIVKDKIAGTIRKALDRLKLDT